MLTEIEMQQEVVDVRNNICQYLYHGGPRVTLRDLIWHLNNDVLTIARMFGQFIDMYTSDEVKETVIEDKVLVLSIFDLHTQVITHVRALVKGLDPEAKLGVN